MPETKEIFTAITGAGSILEYFRKEGIKVGKSKLYEDIKAGCITRQPDGSYTRKAVDAYAEPYRTEVPEEKARENNELARRRQEAEIAKIDAQRKKIEIQTQRDLGHLIPREEVNTAMASRAVTLEAEIKTAMERELLDLIHAVKGDPRHALDMQRKMEGIVNSALHNYSKPLDLEVEFTDEGIDSESE